VLSFTLTCKVVLVGLCLAFFHTRSRRCLFFIASSSIPTFFCICSGLFTSSYQWCSVIICLNLWGTSSWCMSSFFWLLGVDAV
jgi:hypothetical protein